VLARSDPGHFSRALKRYCADEQGNLHGFDESVERMTQFMRRQDPSLDEAAARQRTLAYMATMPAWKNHPKLQAAMS